jgi:hypothetical protein
MEEYPEPKTVDAGPPETQDEEDTAPRRSGPTPQELDRRDREKQERRKPMGPTKDDIDEDHPEEDVEPPAVPPTSPSQIP